MKDTVLLALDASPAHGEVLALARRHCTPNVHALRVILVIDPTYAVHPQPHPYTIAEQDAYPAACEEQRLAESTVAAAIETLRQAGFEAQGEVVPGEPLGQILAHAERVAWVIMGHRHLSRLGRLLDPSLSAKVLDSVRVPVLVVPA